MVMISSLSNKLREYAWLSPLQHGRSYKEVRLYYHSERIFHFSVDFSHLFLLNEESVNVVVEIE